jgi:DNA-3-methyladenine glycosylase II
MANHTGFEQQESMEQFSEEALARAVRTLGRRDPVLRPVIRRWGAPTFRPHADYFDTLVDSIVSQQISGAAAASILRRMRAALGERFEPGIFLEAPDESFRGSGVSPQKLSYLRSLAEHVESGRLDLAKLPAMADSEVVAALTDVRGVGVWTAQMFLIFSLGRLDILPTGDLGVRKGTRIAYGLSDLPTPRQVEDLAAERTWAPYRSVASWYMWRVLEP